MHYRAISNTRSHFEVFESERVTLLRGSVGLFSIISLVINCVFEFTSNVLFPLRLPLALLICVRLIRQSLVAN